MAVKNEKAPKTGINEANEKSLTTALNSEPEDLSSEKYLDIKEAGALAAEAELKGNDANVSYHTEWANRKIRSQDDPEAAQKAFTDAYKSYMDDDHRTRMGGRLLEKLGIHDSDIFHRVLEQLKGMTRVIHRESHGLDKFWRKCPHPFCCAKREVIEESELLFYGEIQND